MLLPNANQRFFLDFFGCNHDQLLQWAILPMRVFILDMMIELIQWIQQRNHKSYFSHRKTNLVLKNI
jgi:hypothetical protein